MSKYASALQQQQLAILRQHSAQLEQQAAATAAAAAAAASDITNVNPAAKDDFMTAAGEEPVSNAIEIFLVSSFSLKLSSSSRFTSLRILLKINT